MDDSERNETLGFLQEKGDTFVKLSNAERKRLADLGEFDWLLRLPLPIESMFIFKFLDFLI